MRRGRKRWLAWPRGIQAKFLIALAIFVTLCMTLLGVTMFFNELRIMNQRLEQETETLTQVLKDKASAASTFLARIAPPAIFAYDYLLLESYVEELSSDSDTVFAVILNPSGAPLTHFLKREDPYFRRLHATLEPANFTAILTRLRNDPALVIARRAIEYEGTRLGIAEVGLSRVRVSQRAEELRVSSRNELKRITLITGGLIFSSLFMLVLLIEGTFRRLVVRPIHGLVTQMGRVESGDFGARAVVRSQDEIGRLAQSFNSVASELQAQLNNLAQQHRAYKETRDYLANVLEHSADMIATTDLDGRIVEFNSGAERTLGFNRAEVIGKSSAAFYSDCAQMTQLYQVVYRGQPVQGVETRLKRKDGTTIDVELTLSPLRNNASQLIGVICIGHDVTQAKIMREKLIQAEKMASVGQVAAWITHQIRNSLGRILLSTSSLQPVAGTPDSKSQRDMLEAIHSMDRMVTDLLDYSKTLKLHPVPLRLDSSLEGLLAQIETQAGREISIERRYASDMPILYADVFKLEQAIGNIFKNALEAMQEQGVLRVSTEFDRDEREVTITIADNGRGISPDNMTEVLNPFFTTKPRGTGLGLAMAARIVEAHGGALRVRSAPGKGTEVTIALPINPAHLEEQP